MSWVAGLLQLFADSISGVGEVVVGLSKTSAAGPLLWAIGSVIALLGTLLHWVIFPLTWLRDQMQAAGQGLWPDFLITAVIVSVILFMLGGGARAGARPLIASLGTFAGMAAVIKLMGLDHGGLPVVDTRLWGGLLVTLVIAITGIVASLPIGVALALGRRSTIP